MKLSRLLEVECSVPNPDAAVRTAATVFGSKRVKSTIRSAAAHIVVGESVIAFSNGADGATPRTENLCFATDDLDAAREEAAAAGIEVTASEAPAPALQLNTAPVLGFDVVLVETAPATGSARPQDVHPGFEATERISPMFQVEPVVPSIEGATELVQNLFSGRLVEESFAASLEGIAPAQRIRHLLLGDAVIQLIEMTAVLPGFSWSDLYENHGPSVHNLTFMVPNIAQTISELEAEGVEILLSADLPWADIIGAENAKPGAEAFCIAATGPLFGFHLELCEPFTERVLGLLHRPVWGIG